MIYLKSKRWIETEPKNIGARRRKTNNDQQHRQFINEISTFFSLLGSGSMACEMWEKKELFGRRCDGMAKNKHLMLSMAMCPRRRLRSRSRRSFVVFILPFLAFALCPCAVPDRVPLTFRIDFFCALTLRTHTIRTRSSRSDDTEDSTTPITIMMLLSMTWR